jgi:hypothetical protein
MQDDATQDNATDTNTPLHTKITFKIALVKIADFVKKHWKVELVLAVVITIIVTLFSLIPVIPVNETRLVNLGATVRLKSGEVAKLKSGNVSVKINHFTNDTCPKGSQCFWSGQAVEYMLTVDGQKYATGSLNTNNGSPYRVETVSSDYNTYAEIQITRAK